MIVFKPEDWIGRTFKCLDTGEKVKLTKKMVKPKAFISIGNGYIDLGDGYYYRGGGNIQEITKQKKIDPDAI